MQTQTTEVSLLKFDVLGFSLSTQPCEIKAGSFYFTIGAEMRVDPEKNYITPVMNVKIFSKDTPVIRQDGEEEVRQVLGEFICGAIYRIKNISEFIHNDKLEIPKDVEDLINTTTYNTMRGTMIAAFKGTYLHGALLPLINPSVFVKAHNWSLLSNGSKDQEER